jgi:hypothetical protein
MAGNSQFDSFDRSLFESSSESLDSILRPIRDKRTEILEAFSKAYLAETGLLPSQCELVEVRNADGWTFTWFFRKREQAGEVSG